jgi:malonate decarboxylase epsilon subunit
VSTAFLFPGQGSQVPGMLHTLPDHGSVRGTLEEASECLRRDVLEMDTATALQSTVPVQLALLISGVAVARALIVEGVEPAAVAGMSAGAFSAAVVSGALRFTDGIRLIRQRAEMMAGLYPQGYGLSIVIGLTEAQALDIVKHAGSRDEPLFITNINAPRQIGISGSEQAMERAVEIARNRGARKVIRLNVSVPSHCPLLEPVAGALRVALTTIVLEEPKTVYIGNITGRALRSAKAIAEDVVGNVAHGIRWHDGTTVLEELGCRTFIEMPPGHALSDLAQGAFKDVRTISIGKTSLGYAARIAAHKQAVRSSDANFNPGREIP